MQVWVAMILFATLYSNSSAGAVTGRIAWSDVILVASAGLAVLRLLTYKQTEFGRYFRYLAIPFAFAFFVFALFILTTQDSPLVYSVNAFALMYLVIPGLLLTTPRIPSDVRPLTLATLGVIAYFCLLAIGGGQADSYRAAAAGTFRNPNHASAFAALAVLFIVLLADGYILLRAALLLASLSVVADTFSFGAVLALAMALVTGFWLRIRRPEVRVMILVGSMVGVFLLDWLLTFLGRWVPRLENGTSNLERSRDDRYAIWERAQGLFNDQPMGIGLGHVSEAVGSDVHNEYLTFLAAFGLLGPLMFFMLFVAIWMMGKARTRAVAVFIFVDAYTHDSFSWRYQWVFLAMAMIYDHVSSDKAVPDSPEEPEPVQGQRVNPVRPVAASLLPTANPAAKRPLGWGGWDTRNPALPPRES